MLQYTTIFLHYLLLSVLWVLILSERSFLRVWVSKDLIIMEVHCITLLPTKLSFWLLLFTFIFKFFSFIWLSRVIARLLFYQELYQATSANRLSALIQVMAISLIMPAIRLCWLKLYPLRHQRSFRLWKFSWFRWKCFWWLQFHCFFCRNLQLIKVVKHLRSVFLLNQITAFWSLYCSNAKSSFYFFHFKVAEVEFPSMLG